MHEIFEWSRVLMNELPYDFLFEVIFRSVVMFVFLLIFLRLAGKRGVKQLSVFEVVIIVALGSAVGDPMLYDNVGVIPGIVVVIVVIGLYRIITVLSSKFSWLEHFLEGNPKCLIRNGEFVLDSLNKENLAQDEFFAELRLRSIEHLGQIKYAYLETTGEISVFFIENDEVSYGLPILPELFNKQQANKSKESHYACRFCGYIVQIKNKKQICDKCTKSDWVEAIKTRRIT